MWYLLWVCLMTLLPQYSLFQAIATHSEVITNSCLKFSTSTDAMFANALMYLNNVPGSCSPFLSN